MKNRDIPWSVDVIKNRGNSRGSEAGTTPGRCTMDIVFTRKEALVERGKRDNSNDLVMKDDTVPSHECETQERIL